MVVLKEPDPLAVKLCLKTLKALGSKDPERDFLIIRRDVVGGILYSPAEIKRLKDSCAFWARDLNVPACRGFNYGALNGKPKLSFPLIANALGDRNHSSVVDAINRHERYVNY